MTVNELIDAIIEKTANSIAIRYPDGKPITTYNKLFDYLGISKYQRKQIPDLNKVIAQILIGGESYLLLNPKFDTRDLNQCSSSLLLNDMRNLAFENLE